MQPWIHLVFAIAVTAYFLFRFIKDRQIYELLFVIWVPSTLLQYLSNNPVFIRGLGIFQLIMFISVIYFLFKKRGDRRHKTAEILTKYATGDLDDAVIAHDENLHEQDLQEEISIDNAIDSDEVTKLPNDDTD